MNRVVELYEANHLMALVIVFIGFIIYINAMKNKFHKSLFVQNEVNDEDDNEDEIPESQVEDEMNLNTENEMVNMKFKEYTYSRLRVTQEMYDYLIKHPNMGLKIIVSENNGNHPIGYYEIPYDVAIRFIKEKQTFPNWKDYKNFNQETIPTELREYFTIVPSNNINLNELDKKTLKINSPKEIKMTKDLKSDTLENFRIYLIQKGYSEFTPAGNRSTVYDYVNRVDKILERERISIFKLAENIDFYVRKYDFDGIEAEYGNEGHRAVINALKRFQDFCR